MGYLSLDDFEHRIICYMNSDYFVYMLGCVDGNLYTGMAVDVKKRFSEHLRGKGARYTRAHKPMEIVYIEKCKSRSVALKREIQIKSLSRAKKLELVKG